VPSFADNYPVKLGRVACARGVVPAALQFATRSSAFLRSLRNTRAAACLPTSPSVSQLPKHHCGVYLLAYTPLPYTANLGIMDSDWARLDSDLLELVGTWMSAREARVSRLLCRAWASGVAASCRKLSVYGDMPAGLLSRFRNTTNLTWRDLPHHKLGDLRALGASLTSLTLSASTTQFRFADTRQTNEGLAQLRPLTNITSLDARGPFHVIDQRGLKILGELTSLRSLRLAESYGDMDSRLAIIGSLANLQPLVRLTSLSLEGCLELSAAQLTGLARLPSLTHLELRNCGVDNEGVGALAPLTRLRSLNLAWSDRLTDAGLAALHPLTELTRLDTDWCSNLTTDGLLRLKEHLSSLIYVGVPHPIDYYSWDGEMDCYSDWDLDYSDEDF